MSEMRMDPKSPNLACKNCLDRKTPVSKSPSASSLAPKKDPYADIDAPSKKSSEKISYFCKSCRYSFTRAGHISVSACPYCGMQGSVVSKGSASSMIKEVDDMMDDEE
jgi:DNA-directed RNA polymerase subunit RPC12/RpoP